MKKKYSFILLIFTFYLFFDLSDLKCDERFYENVEEESRSNVLPASRRGTTFYPSGEGTLQIHKMLTARSFQNADGRFSKTCVLSSPGVYFLTESVTTEILEASASSIYISSSNVVLNLGTKSIAQNFNGASSSIIKIAADSKNVCIENGSINARTDNIAPGKGIEVLNNCTGIKLKNLNIFSCADFGIHLSGTEESSIKKVEIKNCEICICSGDNNFKDACGLKASYCDFLEIDSVVSTNNIHSLSTNNAYGMNINNCREIFIENSFASNNFTNAHLGLACGISLNDVENATIKNTSASSNLGSSGIAFGLRMNLCFSIKVIDSVFSNNKAQAGVGISYGIYDCNGTTNVFENCMLKNNFGDSKGHGICLENANSSIVKKCEIIGNNGNTSYGIRLSGTTKHCRITENFIQGHTGVLIGYGIIDDSGSYTKCCFDKNFVFTSSTNSVGYSIEFDSGKLFLETATSVGKLKDIKTDKTDLSNILIIAE